MKQASAWMRPLWIVLGFVCVGIGFVGFYTPGMPGTVFFILAAACFARSSPRFHGWLLGLPVAGPLIQDFQGGLGMPARAKGLAMTMIVLSSITSSFVLYGRVLQRTGSDLYAVGVVAAIWILAVAGVWYIGWKVPTREQVLRERIAAEPERR